MHILHPYIDVMVVKDVQGIHRLICNINQERHDLQRHPICLTDSYHDYILDEILRRDKIGGDYVESFIGFFSK